jgi:hypothetical protein
LFFAGASLLAKGIREQARSCMFDTTSQFGKDAPMYRFSKKMIAVFMMLWLPLFSGSALAASVTMQMPSSHCHDEAMSMTQEMDMAGMDMSEHQHSEMAAAADEHDPSCSACGVCHLACTGYLAVPGVEMAAVQNSTREITPYLVSFRSFTSAPLLPPPLARA